MTGRKVVLAASTREGEEAPLLAAWREQAMSLAPPRPLVLIVPRHPQRFDEVATLIEASGLSMRRRGSWADAPPPDVSAADALHGDSLGEMALYFAAAMSPCSAAASHRWAGRT